MAIIELILIYGVGCGRVERNLEGWYNEGDEKVGLF